MMLKSKKLINDADIRINCMKQIVKKDILALLKKALRAIREGEIINLRTISNEVIHNASIFQDSDSISTAVIIYSLSKLYKQEDDVEKFLIPYLQSMITSLSKNDYEKYRETSKELIKGISKRYSKTRTYIGEILQRAQISKASKIYEHGISLARVSETLGVSMWELMDYVGKTNIPDSFGESLDVKKKLEFARSLFA